MNFWNVLKKDDLTEAKLYYADSAVKKDNRKTEINYNEESDVAKGLESLKKF